jgi:hypothetical protein
MFIHDYRSWSQLRSSGAPQREIDRAVERGELVRVWPGRYVPASQDADARWRSNLAAFLSRDIAGGVASHRSAARLHGLDGAWSEPFDALVAHNSFRHPTAFRTHDVPKEHVTVVDAMSCTTVKRTLLDLGRVISADQLELAVESALRGANPKRPDVWNELLLEELLDFPNSPRILGASRLSYVLARRPLGIRPTGSGAETRMVQAIRPNGLDLTMIRQAKVVIVDHVAKTEQTLYPDGLFPSIGLSLETDGIAEHSGYSRRSRDDIRENKATAALHIIRFTGERIYREPRQVGNEVHAAYLAAQRRGLPANVTMRQLGPNDFQYDINVTKRTT